MALQEEGRGDTKPALPRLSLLCDSLVGLHFGVQFKAFLSNVLSTCGVLL